MAGEEAVTALELFITVVFLCALIAMTGVFMHICNKLQELHLSMNSRLDELVATTNSLSRAEGFRAGQESRDLIKKAGDVVTQGHD
jgi:hypothetical protein